jgi:hypothetical protein
MGLPAYGSSISGLFPSGGTSGGMVFQGMLWGESWFQDHFGVTNWFPSVQLGLGLTLVVPNRKAPPIESALQLHE